MRVGDYAFTKTRYLALFVLVLCAWLIYELTSDPYEEQKAAILAPETSPNPVAAPADEPSSDLDYEKIQATAMTKQTLWGVLIRDQAVAPRKPNLNDMIQGLAVTTVVSVNNEVQAVIKDEKNKTEELYKKGDSIREFTVDEFTQSDVVLSYQGEKVKLPF